MFIGCISLTTASHLPATTLKRRCYYVMFDDCFSLAEAPELPAPVLADSCYMGMFYHCSSLHEVTCLATDISAAGCVYEWLGGVAPSGTFCKAPEMEDWPLNSDSGIPEGWAVDNYDGVNEQQGQVAVYPNPVKDKLHVAGTDIQSVKVFDAQGRLVHSERCGHDNQVEVDFQGYSKGIYSVSIQSEGSNVTKTIVH
jgi:hypothetical protein